MFVDLTCGSCDAHFNIDCEDNDTGVWLLVNRFTNAHTVCGYMTPVETDETVSARRRVVRLAPQKGATDG